VLELSSSNLFVVLQDGTVRTPALVEHVLPGLTRATLLQLAAEAQLEISEGAISLAELRTAREIFVTATTKELVPVCAVDETALPVRGPVTCRLMGLLAQHVERELGIVHPRRALLDELCA
jgi:branched-subunit amino acid aminotransferase/4-amino-4-deoxychorismate lyase